ncbi:MAG: helical backbone metal receptor [Candidatus Margulisbacteria bacterium]|nr:helical backbone metal receptor [Candidatus Margulisiibacteriota bacterium]
MSFNLFGRHPDRSGDIFSSTLRDYFGQPVVWMSVLFFLLSFAFPMRLISTAPSITETVYLLGAQKNLVAVSKYCDYPPEAKSLPNIGGYYDFNQEEILWLKPDRVLLLKDADLLKNFLRQQRIAYTSFDNESVEGIYDLILKTGELTGTKSAAKKEVAKLKAKMAEYKERFKNRPVRKILVILEQVIKNKQVESVYILGREKFYADLIKVLKFENVYKGRQKYPLISKEGLLYFNPDLILVLENGDKQTYKSLPVKAVKENHIYFFKNEVMKRPGPRFTEIIEKLSEL